MNDREKWRERTSDIRACGTTWWWWWWWFSIRHSDNNTGLKFLINLNSCAPDGLDSSSDPQFFQPYLKAFMDLSKDTSYNFYHSYLHVQQHLFSSQASPRRLSLKLFRFTLYSMGNVKSIQWQVLFSGLLYFSFFYFF